MLMLPRLVEQEIIPMPDDFKLRDIQTIMRNNLAKEFRAGVRSMVLMAPTGSGKTIFAGFIFYNMLKKNPKQRLIFIVPRNTLVQQTYEVFTKLFGFDVSVIQGIDERINMAKQVHIATIQTLGRRIKKYAGFQELNFGCAIVDESHIIFKDIELIKADILIGLTATPYTKGLGLIYEKLIKSVSAKELTEQGVITPIRVYCAKKQINTANLSVKSTGEYDSSEEDAELEGIVCDVIKEYKANPEMKGRPFLGFAKSIKSCIALASAFNSAGIRCGFVHSKMSDDDCSSVLNTFENGGFDGVFSVVKLIEGYDFPEASALLLCTSFAPSKDCENTPNALNRYVQMIGRCRRSYPGKKEAIIHDHGQNYEKYGNPDDFEEGFNTLDMGKRKTKAKTDAKPKRAKPKECPSCGYFINVGNRCNNCGHKLKKYTEIIDGEPVNFIDGKMVLSEKSHNIYSVDPKKRNRDTTSKEKIEFFGGLKYHAKIKGYKPGWASHTYKLFFGVWPNKYKDATLIPPNKQVEDFMRAKEVIDKHRSR